MDKKVVKLCISDIIESTISILIKKAEIFLPNHLFRGLIFLVFFESVGYFYRHISFACNLFDRNIATFRHVNRHVVRSDVGYIRSGFWIAWLIKVRIWILVRWRNKVSFYFGRVSRIIESEFSEITFWVQ